MCSQVGVDRPNPDWPSKNAAQRALSGSPALAFPHLHRAHRREHLFDLRAAEQTLRSPTRGQGRGQALRQRLTPPALSCDVQGATIGGGTGRGRGTAIRNSDNTLAPIHNLRGTFFRRVLCGGGPSRIRSSGQERPPSPTSSVAPPLTRTGSLLPFLCETSGGGKGMGQRMRISKLTQLTSRVKPVRPSQRGGAEPCRHETRHDAEHLVRSLARVYCRETRTLFSVALFGKSPQKCAALAEKPCPEERTADGRESIRPLRFEGRIDP